MENIFLANIHNLEPGGYYVRVTIESKIWQLPPVIGYFMVFVKETEFTIQKSSPPFSTGQANMRNLHFPVVLIVLLFLVFTSFGIELYYIQSACVPFPTKLILLLLINLTFIALLTLMFFVIKNLVKLYFERKHQVPGYKFKTKLVVIFVTLTLIPATVLFIMASGLITTYIDRWFAPQIRQPLEKSLEIAKVMYDIEKQKSLGYAQSLAAGSSVSEGYQIRYLNDISKDATETMYLGFEGKEGTEVISGDKGDIAFRTGIALPAKWPSAYLAISGPSHRHHYGIAGTRVGFQFVLA